MIADPELHRRLITGTKVGPICGYGLYSTGFDVWAYMRGLLPPLDAKPEMLLGTELEEPLLLKTYPRLTGRPATMCNELQRHPTMEWLGVTPDAFSGSDRVVDAKVVRRYWGPTADDMPAAIQLQMLTQMGVCGRRYADVIALNGTQPQVYTMEWDEAWWQAVVARLWDWYRRYILGDEMPPIDGSDSASRWLQQTFPNHKRPDLREATDKEIASLQEYARLRNAQRALAKRRKDMENLFKLAIGQSQKEGLFWHQGKFTWRRSADGHSIDWESLGLALLTHHIKGEAERQALLDQYTRTRPGSRRIWFDCELLEEVDDAAA